MTASRTDVSLRTERTDPFTDETTAALLGAFDFDDGVFLDVTIKP